MELLPPMRAHGRAVPLLVVGIWAGLLGCAGAEAAEVTAPGAAREALKGAAAALGALWQGEGGATKAVAAYEQHMARLVALPTDVLDGLSRRAVGGALEQKLVHIAADRKGSAAAYEAVRDAIDRAYATERRRRIYMPFVDPALAQARYRLVWEELALRPTTPRAPTARLALSMIGQIGDAESIPALVAAYRLSLPKRQHWVIRSALIGALMTLRKAAGEHRAFDAAYECYQMSGHPQDRERWLLAVASWLRPEEVRRLLDRAQAQAKLLQQVLHAQAKGNAPATDP